MESTFTDGRILIRPVRPDDAPRLFDAARESIAEVYPFLPWCHPEYALQESIEWTAAQPGRWTDGSDYAFGIYDADGERYLGGVGINSINRLHQIGNLGYWVRTSAAGRGVATAATILCARFAMKELELTRVEIMASTENVASCRVAVKAGAVREGVLRNRLLLNGRLHDAVMHSLIPGDV